MAGTGAGKAGRPNGLGLRRKDPSVNASTSTARGGVASSAKLRKKERWMATEVKKSEVVPSLIIPIPLH